ncbi:hypothetical protein A1OQ_11615 [Enterovibrio norvegicus FF-162]|uniref:DUF2787 domain-containing protein n=1 Tax=Enterovibrio norvegicus TaxID=188144 RepID=UPI000306A147|nr:DUF2787 domain-containing protein [Enterovibrio norvegicus]OEE89420.1 hypothetical protein A1OQ_11615 [Enterovibrio norvegicus FF-162]
MSDVTFEPSSLPVSNKLQALLALTLLEKQKQDARLCDGRYLVFNFRESSYSAETGGFHPVEIGICKTADGTWSIEYITDFSYVGSYYPELERCIDFDFRVQSFFAQYCGWQSIDGNASAVELYQLWEGNFLSYAAMEVYDEVTVSAEC